MKNIKPQKTLEPKTRSQIANDLGFSARTLNRKLKSANIQLPKGLVNPENQVKIYKILGFEARFNEHT
jgi:DNA-binding transcriptional regulator LsrR (DeoR family)